jgi:flagellar assembly factor FliW
VTDAMPIEVPLGLPGVTARPGFELRARAQGSAYTWLRSTEEPAVELLAVDVLRLCPDYPVDQVRRSLAFLRLRDDEPLLVLALCTVPAGSEPATANLLAPVAVGLESRRAAQIVLHDSRWSDHALLPA